LENELAGLQTAASKSIDRRVKALAVAGTLGQRMVSSVKEGISLKARAQMLKEDIIRQATVRMVRLHEEEEMWALEQALSALGDDSQPHSSDAIKRCRLILTERHQLVSHRLQRAEDVAAGGDGSITKPPQQPNSSASSITASNGNGGYVAEVSVPKPLRSVVDKKSPEILTPAYWASLTGLEVSSSSPSVGAALTAPLWEGGGLLPGSTDRQAWANSLLKEGWASSGHLSNGVAESAAKLHSAMLRLREAGCLLCSYS